MTSSDMDAAVERLRDLAEAAAPGLWNSGARKWAPDRDFIAAASPDVVLALLDALAEAQSNVKLLTLDTEILTVRAEAAEKERDEYVKRMKFCHDRERKFQAERDAAEAKLARIAEVVARDALAHDPLCPCGDNAPVWATRTARDIAGILNNEGTESNGDD